MQLSSTKSLVLSLLAAGPLALAAPTQLQPATAHSVQPYHQDRNAVLFHDDPVRRRSTQALAIPAQHLYGRATGQPGAPPGDRGQTRPPNEPNAPAAPNPPGEPNAPEEPNPVADPNAGGGTPAQGQPRLDNQPDPDAPVDLRKDNLPAYKPDSPEWAANKPLLIAKGQGLIDMLKTTIASNQPDTGDQRPLIGPAGPGLSAEDPTAADGDDFDNLEDEPFNIDPSAEFKKRVILRGSKVALEMTASKSNNFASVGQSYKQEGVAWTHAAFDSLKTLLEGSDGLKNLKWLERNTIISWGTKDSNGVLLHTQDAIDFAFDTLYERPEGADPDARKDWLAIDFASTDEQVVEVRNYLAAQTHVARVLQLLAGYHNEFGNKQISKLYVGDDETAALREYGIVIELTDAVSEGTE